MIWVLDRSDLSISGRLGLYGQGPGQLVSVRSLWFGDGGALLNAFDHAVRRVTTYRLSDGQPTRFALLPEAADSSDAVVVRGGQLVVNGWRSSELFQVYTAPPGVADGTDSVEWELVRESGRGWFPDLGEGERYLLSRNYIAANPATGEVVAAFAAANRLTFLDPDGHVAAEVGFAEEIDTRLDEIGEYHADAETAYLDIAADASRVYALHRGSPQRPRDVSSRIIHVFDWNGDLVEVLELSEAVRYIGISSDAMPTSPTVLYGVAVFPATIIEFVLDHTRGESG